LAGAAKARRAAIRHHQRMKKATVCAALLAPALFTLSASVAAAEPASTVPASVSDVSDQQTTSEPEAESARLGAYAEVDLGILAFLDQGTAIAGGVTYGPFRAGVSYASFLSNPSLGGVPDGFDLRVNSLLGLNLAYFIGQDTDRGLYVQGMLHIKEQGITNQASGAHVDLDSLAVGAELGYVWKFFEGLYVAPRVGALYYVKTPQPGNAPVAVGDRLYDNDRHHNWDTYLIPTLSLGYSW